MVKSLKIKWELFYLLNIFQFQLIILFPYFWKNDLIPILFKWSQYFGYDFSITWGLLIISDLVLRTKGLKANAILWCYSDWYNIAQSETNFPRFSVQKKIAEILFRCLKNPTVLQFNGITIHCNGSVHCYNYNGSVHCFLPCPPLAADFNQISCSKVKTVLIVSVYSRLHDYNSLNTIICGMQIIITQGNQI